MTPLTPLPRLTALDGDGCSPSTRTRTVSRGIALPPDEEGEEAAAAVEEAAVEELVAVTRQLAVEAMAGAGAATAEAHAGSSV